jgi:two-component system, OmpR family, sensor kinase
VRRADGLLRRATVAAAIQLAVAVAATLVLVAGLAFWLTIRAEHNAEERTVRAVTLAAGPQLIGINGVVLLYRGADGVRDASPGTPAALQGLEVTGLLPGWSDTHIDGRDYEVYVVDRADGSRTVGLLDVTLRNQSAWLLAESLLVAGVLGVAGAAVLGGLLGRRAARPIAQALDMQRRFVADASHELRTPLAVLHTRAQLIQRRLARQAQPVDERLSTDVAQLAADTGALGEVVEDLLLSAELEHHSAREGVAVDTADLVHELVASFSAYAEERGITLRATVGPGDSTVTGVPSSLRRALGALLDNAFSHVTAGGTVTVSVERAAAAGGDVVSVAVANDGEGIDPADSDRLLDRFARGEHAGDAGRRFGLGLSLVREVVEAHGGHLRIGGQPGHGACVTIVLPAAP